VGSNPEAGTPTYDLVPKKMPVRTPTAEGIFADSVRVILLDHADKSFAAQRINALALPS